jgi:hypothetical protein
MLKRGVSMHKQAVLVQDVLSFREYLRPYIEEIWEPYGAHGFDYEQALAFIIRELIWVNTQCNVIGHDEGYGYRMIYHNLQAVMQRPTLFECFKHLIRVPVVYGDAELVVALDGRDLVIMYFIPQPLQFV